MFKLLSWSRVFAFTGNEWLSASSRLKYQHICGGFSSDCRFVTIFFCCRYRGLEGFIARNFIENKTNKQCTRIAFSSGYKLQYADHGTSASMVCAVLQDVCVCACVRVCVCVCVRARACDYLLFAALFNTCALPGPQCVAGCPDSCLWFGKKLGYSRRYCSVRIQTTNKQNGAQRIV